MTDAQLIQIQKRVDGTNKLVGFETAVVQLNGPKLFVYNPRTGFKKSIMKFPMGLPDISQSL